MGVHTGWVYELSRMTPSRASVSMCGMCTALLCHGTSLYPTSCIGAVQANKNNIAYTNINANGKRRANKIRL